MKKYGMLVLAILLALLAFALPASASDRRSQRRSNRHNGNVIVIPQVRVSGFPEYHSYYGNRRHGYGLSVRDVIGAAVVVGGVVAIEKVANRNRDDDSAAKETAKCFERIMKSAKKHHIAVDPEQVMAGCSGQPLQQSEPERGPSVRDQSEERTPEPPPVTTPSVRRGVYEENGVVCNDDLRPLTILVNGIPAGTLAPGGRLTLSHLPAGKVCYVQAGKSKCAQ